MIMQCTPLAHIRAFHKDLLVILLVFRQLREERVGMQAQGRLPQHLVDLAADVEGHEIRSTRHGPHNLWFISWQSETCAQVATLATLAADIKSQAKQLVLVGWCRRGNYIAASWDAVAGAVGACSQDAFKRRVGCFQIWGA